MLFLVAFNLRHLLIDDERNLRADDIARTYQEGIDFLSKNHYSLLLLDHDLGEEKSGYDIMCWLEENQEHLPDKIVCVSSNPPGKKRIDMIIDKLGCR